MKNKALTYILLVVVALIWYQVFFRVKGSLLGEDQAEIPSSNVGQNDMPSIFRDTFELLANYRDPFGEVRKPVLAANAPIAVPRPSITRELKPQFAWPKIIYKGRVKKTNSRNPLGIVNIDGIQLMIRNGEELFNDIVVKTIGRDSILVVHKKDKKIIWRN